MARNSLYWDDFERRITETVSYLETGCHVPVRRVAVFVTERCNFSCQYCNHRFSNSEMSEECFDRIVKEYGNDAIIHITGGEPSVVKWLYPYLEKNGSNYRFHLNTNAFIAPPSKSIKRLKVSLDSHSSACWNALIGRKAFDVVVNNIKKCIQDTVVSITFTMTRQNYRTIPDFIRFSQREFDGIYALFFSVYKGDNERFAFTPDAAKDFFESIKPEMEEILDQESRALLNETISEKFRIMQGERFPENKGNYCYLSLSERVFLSDGTMSGCSHLIRDRVKVVPGTKHEKCLYGCNRRLVTFNETVESMLKKES